MCPGALGVILGRVDCEVSTGIWHKRNAAIARAINRNLKQQNNTKDMIVHKFRRKDINLISLLDYEVNFGSSFSIKQA